MKPEFNAFFQAIDSPFSNKEEIERAWEKFLASSPHEEEIKIIINGLTKRNEEKVGDFLQKACERLLKMNSQGPEKNLSEFEKRKRETVRKENLFFLLTRPVISFELRQKVWETLKTLDPLLLDFHKKQAELPPLTREDYRRLIAEIPDEKFKEEVLLPAFFRFLSENPELKKPTDQTYIQKHIRSEKARKLTKEFFEPPRKRWWKIW